MIQAHSKTLVAQLVRAARVPPVSRVARIVLWAAVVVSSAAATAAVVAAKSAVAAVAAAVVAAVAVEAVGLRQTRRLRPLQWEVEPKFASAYAALLCARFLPSAS